MNAFDQIRRMQVGESLCWDNPAMCCSMIADHINRDGKQFKVDWICENWEASQGYTLVRRIA